jgi:hypothetical protein
MLAAVRAAARLYHHDCDQEQRQLAAVAETLERDVLESAFMLAISEMAESQ